MNQHHRNTPYLLLLGIGLVWATLLVVGSHKKQILPTAAQVAGPKPETVARAVAKNGTATQTQPETQVHTQVQAQSETQPVTCWQAQFALQASRLNRVQKESLGARSHRIHLGGIIEKFTPPSQQGRFCVRSRGYALAFQTDSKDPSVLVIHGGTGRIQEKSRLEVEFCAEGQKCAPCQVRKDNFEEALLGENAADSLANEDEDVTNQLSAEVRRELARMEEQGKPTAIDAWEVTHSQAGCSHRS